MITVSINQNQVPHKLLCISMLYRYSFFYKVVRIYFNWVKKSIVVNDTRGTKWTRSRPLFTIMVTDSLHIDAVEALSINISILIFGWGQDPYVSTINASDDVREAGLWIKPSFYGRPGIGGYWPPNEMLRLSNKSISYVPNCLWDGTLVKPYRKW